MEMFDYLLKLTGMNFDEMNDQELSNVILNYSNSVMNENSKLLKLSLNNSVDDIKKIFTEIKQCVIYEIECLLNSKPTPQVLSLLGMSAVADYKNDRFRVKIEAIFEDKEFSIKEEYRRINKIILYACINFLKPGMIKKCNLCKGFFRTKTKRKQKFCSEECREV